MVLVTSPVDCVVAVGVVVVGMVIVKDGSVLESLVRVPVVVDSVVKDSVICISVVEDCIVAGLDVPGCVGTGSTTMLGVLLWLPASGFPACVKLGSETTGSSEFATFLYRHMPPSGLNLSNQKNIEKRRVSKERASK